MKKISLSLVIMIAFLMLPFSVLADKVNTDSNIENSQNQENSKVEDEDEDENEEEESKEVNVYFFHGDGCPHCADAKKFFDSIEEQYGHLFKLVAYETWYDSSNAALLEKVGEAREEDITGVPYILIGNKSWGGYASDLDEDIIKTIENEYNKPVDERYDIMDLIDVDDNEKEDYSDDAMILIVILVVTAAIVGGVVFARKKTA